MPDSPIGKTRDAGWQLGVRRTYPLDLWPAWECLLAPTGRAVWLGTDAPLDWSLKVPQILPHGLEIEFRVLKPGSHLRLQYFTASLARPSRLQIRVLPAKTGTTVAIHQEMLSTATERAQGLDHWKGVLHALDPLFRNCQKDVQNPSKSNQF